MTTIKPLPLIAWTLFFVFTVAFLVDALRVDWFKGLLMLALFVTAVLSSIISTMPRESRQERLSKIK